METESEKMKVLIVDDSNLNIKVARKILEHEGIEVEEASSGKECLEKVLTTEYDIIFMDIMMPEMDGVETLKELEKIQSFRTPVVALTADAVSGAKEKYLSLGFKAYIPKPINIELLRSIIASIKME